MALERLVVIGAGAVGGALGGLVAGTGLPVVLVARGAHAERLQARGLTLRRPDGDVQMPITALDADALDRLEWRPGDLALVATKLYDAEAAYAGLAGLAGPDLPVAIGQNGLAADPWAQSRFRTAIRTMVYLPAQHLEPGVVELHGDPGPGIVDVGPEGAELAAVLRDAGLDSVVREDIDAWRRAKWLTNLCGAAVTFGHGDWVPELVAEGRRTLQAAGLPCVDDATFRARTGWLGLAPIHGERRLRGGSTHQSHVRGRPLEIPWLNGPMVELAHGNHVPVPLNEAVLAWAEAPPDMPADG